MDLIKIKNTSSEKHLSKRMKKQAIDWEKTFASRISGKGLLSLQVNKLQNGPVKNPTQSNQKMDKRQGKIFHQKGYADGQNIHEKMFNTTIC